MRKSSERDANTEWCITPAVIYLSFLTPSSGSGGIGISCRECILRYLTNVISHFFMEQLEESLRDIFRGGESLSHIFSAENHFRDTLISHSCALSSQDVMLCPFSKDVLVLPQFHVSTGTGSEVDGAPAPKLWKVGIPLFWRKYKSSCSKDRDGF